MEHSLDYIAQTISTIAPVSRLFFGAETECGIRNLLSPSHLSEYKTDCM